MHLRLVAFELGPAVPPSSSLYMMGTLCIYMYCTTLYFIAEPLLRNTRTKGNLIISETTSPQCVSILLSSPSSASRSLSHTPPQHGKPSRPSPSTPAKNTLHSSYHHQPSPSSAASCLITPPTSSLLSQARHSCNFTPFPPTPGHLAHHFPFL